MSGGLVKINPQRNVSDEQLRANVLASFAWPQFKIGGESGSVVICAAGPSLLEELPTIKALYAAGIPVCAVKGVADILIENGIIPKYAVFMDGQEDQMRFITKPHPDVEYLVSGTCRPEFFEALRGFKVTAWQGQEKDLMPSGTKYVSGGSFTGLRAIQLMRCKGYSAHHLFGFDCSAREKKTHAYSTRERDLQEVTLLGRDFLTTHALVCQHQQFLDWYCTEKIDCALFMYGDGMLQHAVRALENGPLGTFELWPMYHVFPESARANVTLNQALANATKKEEAA